MWLLSIMGCSPKNESESVNREASLPANFGFNKMGLTAITSSINHNRNTMSTLYGNSLAIADLKKNTNVKEGVSEHLEGSERVLVLVTWLQKEDPYWYGAKIPGKLISIETLKSNHVLYERKGLRYLLHDGRGIKNSKKESAIRIDSILSMKPALFPPQ